MKRLVIIGASYLQLPLILKAKQMGLETHVFAWECGDIGEKEADYFHPISIIEKERILDECRKINPDGIVSIASDVAVLTVSFIADNLGLIGNDVKSSVISTNKYLMKQAFVRNNIPCARAVLTDGISPVDLSDLKYPLIVKPTDRSGSRGVMRIDSDTEDIMSYVRNAVDLSFEKKAVVEEFIEGNEYSVECISYEGEHTLLAVTRKFTTDAPNYIETAHIEPSGLDPDMVMKVERTVKAALDALEIKYGASHSEIRINDKGEVFVIEVGARMGGDMIGSTLVRLSTGYDFVKAVIDVSLGNKPEVFGEKMRTNAAIRFILDSEDVKVYDRLLKDDPEMIVEASVEREVTGNVTDSSTRKGYFIIASDDRKKIMDYLP